MQTAVPELTRAMLSFGAYTVFALAAVFAILVLIACVRAALRSF